MITDRALLIGMWLADARAAVVRRISAQAGQGIMEYAILLGGIALVAGFAFFAFDFSFDGFAQEIEDCITFSDSCGDDPGS
jgi:hypothetical protein